MDCKATSRSSKPKGERTARRRLMRRSSYLIISANETPSNNIEVIQGHNGGPSSLSKAFNDTVKKIKKNSQKEKGENENFLSDRGNYEVVKKNNPSVNNVGVRNLDESSTELSVKNTRKTAKALMKSVNKAFVKVMTKKTEKHFCEAMSPRVNSDPQTGHITSSDTTRKLQATRDPNDISRSSKPADDIVGKLDPNKTFSIITSPAFEKKNYEMQMKEYEMQMKEYHFKKAFLRLVGVIRFGKHAPSVARPIEPERPETACDEYEHVEHVENMKNSLNMKSNHRKSHSQLNKKVYCFPFDEEGVQELRKDGRLRSILVDMNFVPCAFEIQALDDALSMISVGIKLEQTRYGETL